MHFDEWTRFPQTDMKGGVSKGENRGATGQRLGVPGTLRMHRPARARPGGRKWQDLEQEEQVESSLVNQARAPVGKVRGQEGDENHIRRTDDSAKESRERKTEQE